MVKKPNENRLLPLDGIRGIAILLVFLNHVEVPFLMQSLPTALAPLQQILFTSGVTGVSLLFILSGFLMAYIYPQPASYSGFLQKRYTRIFPLFITMCTVMAFYQVFPDTAWYIKLLSLLGLAGFVHVVWVYGIKKIASSLLSKTLFYGFLGLQILAAFLYMFWIMRNPPIMFNQQIPETLHNAILWLVNLTLTLPFGTYIPQLDGVYWSLTSEVLFYIVYPILCVPLIGLMKKQNRSTKIITIIALIPFFAALQILSHRIYGLGILQFQLFFYFICGIVLANLYKTHGNLFQNIGKMFSKKLQWITIILFFVAISVKTLVFDPYMKSLDVWIHILWAIPLGIVIAIALSNTLLSKMLSSRVLVFLGTISFSIYLSHIPIGLLIKQVYNPTDPLTNLFSLILHLGLTILISMLLYYLLERPYFMKAKTVKPIEASKKTTLNVLFKKASIVLATCCVVLVIAVFNAYQSNFNFFSKEYPIAPTAITAPQSLQKSSSISMQEYPQINIRFTSPDDNLQILTIDVSEKKDANKKDQNQTFVFKIKEAGAKDWYAVNEYKQDISLEGDKYPLGFPAINNARGKEYLVELNTTNPNASTFPVINSSPTILTNIVQVDKKTLLTNPVEFASFTFNKVQNVFLNQEARYVMILLLPFLFLSLYLFAITKSLRE